MTLRPAIGLADWLRASRALGVHDEADARALARLLGLAPTPVVTEPSRSRGPDDDAPQPGPHAGSPRPAGDAAPPRSTTPATTPVAAGWDAGPLAVDRLPDLAPAPTPAAIRAVKALPPPGERVDAALDPLLDPRSERALLSAIAALPMAAGEPDLPRLLDAMARGRLPRRLPLQRRPALRRGLQVLVDGAPGMEPFAHDAQQLIAALRRLLPAPALQVGHFLGGRRLDCWMEGADAESPWRPHPDGGPLLLLTDLGIGGLPRGRRDWLRLSHRARGSGIGVRLLVPQSPGRWPRLSERWLVALPWERDLRVGPVQRRIREAAS